MRSPTKNSSPMSRKRSAISSHSYVPGDSVPWSDKETEILKRCLFGHRGSVEDVDWETICSVVFHGRANVVRRDPDSCQARALQLGLVGKGIRVEKIPWKEEEKDALAWAVEGFDGPQSAIPWALIADTLFHGRGGITRRDAKGCREQWNRSMNPDLDHKPLGEWEQQFVYELTTQIGNKWTRISQLLGERFGKAPPGAERVKKGFEKYKRRKDKTDQDGQAVAALDASMAGAISLDASMVGASNSDVSHEATTMPASHEPATSAEIPFHVSESAAIGSSMSFDIASLGLAPPILPYAGGGGGGGAAGGASHSPSKFKPLYPRLAYSQQIPATSHGPLAAQHPWITFGMTTGSFSPDQQLPPPPNPPSPLPLHHPEHSLQSSDLIVESAKVS